MSREYDIRLLNILNSYNNVSKLAEVIILLKHEYVLNSDELELCDECLSDIESYNGSNLSKILNLDANIERYDVLKVENVIDEFICDRRRCEVNDIFSLNSENVFAPDTIGKLLKAYDRRITSSIDSNIFDEDIFMNQTDDVDISSVSNSIDSFSKGLKKGTITTIIGDSSSLKSLWAINIAYEAILNDKNVMYLSINTDKEIQVKRLFTRHNCNEKFPESYTYESMHNKYNQTAVTNVIYDFKERYSKNLIIFDESDMCVPTIRSLRRLIAQAEKYFLDNTDSGIDLIIVDDLTYLPFYNGKRYINARATVISQYYKFFRDEANNLLGSNHGCSFLCTHQDVDDGVLAMKNNGNYKLSFIDKTIVASTNNIFSIYGPSLNCSTKARVKVVKTLYGEVMNGPESISIDCSKWYMSNDSKSLCETKYLIEMQGKEIKNLENQMDLIIEQRDNAEELLNVYRSGEKELSWEEEEISLGEIVSELALELNGRENDNCE